MCRNNTFTLVVLIICLCEMGNKQKVGSRSSCFKKSKSVVKLVKNLITNKNKHHKQHSTTNPKMPKVNYQIIITNKRMLVVNITTTYGNIHLSDMSEVKVQVNKLYPQVTLFETRRGNNCIIYYRIYILNTPMIWQ